MDIFNICLGIDKASNISLYEISNNLDLYAEKKGCFLHTSIFQGITHSKSELISWAKSSESLFTKISTVNLIKLWDQKVKRAGDVYHVNYNVDLTALCLEYKQSIYIRHVATLICNNLKKNGLIIGIREYPPEKFVNSNISYALNYQYRAGFGTIRPHTTLGFCKDFMLSSKTLKSISLKLNDLFIKHSGIYITTMNEYCMTHLLNRETVATL